MNYQDVPIDRQHLFGHYDDEDQHFVYKRNGDVLEVLHPETMRIVKVRVGDSVLCYGKMEGPRSYYRTMGVDKIIDGYVFLKGVTSTAYPLYVFCRLVFDDPSVN